jgi:hypothetical protein
VLDFMAGDVERGAAGEFRQFKPALGIEAWERVREAFAGR